MGRDTSNDVHVVLNHKFCFYGVAAIYKVRKTSRGTSVALLPGQIGLGQKLGIGQDRGQGMAQVMRNRTGHSSNGRQALGMEQPLLRLMQALAHERESIGKLRDLTGAARLDRVRSEEHTSE